MSEIIVNDEDMYTYNQSCMELYPRKIQRETTMSGFTGPEMLLRVSKDSLNNGRKPMYVGEHIRFQDGTTRLLTHVSEDDKNYIFSTELRKLEVINE